MKHRSRMFVCLCGLIILAALPAQVEAAHLESNGQLLVTFGRTFADYKIGEQSSGGLYAHGTALVQLRGTPLLFGYFGPEFTLGDENSSNFKLLTGTFMTGDGGVSTMASLWYNQSLPANLNLFLEGDAYFPIDGSNFGHEFRQYYTYFDISWTINPDSGLGLGIVQENFFSEDDIFEAAIGPKLKFKMASFWFAYDFTPAVDDDHTLLFRLSINL